MSHQIRTGSIVVSKAGRDAGRFMTVVRTDGEWLWLADGDLRKVQKPKKKKLRHVRPVEGELPYVESMLSENTLDARIRKDLALLQGPENNQAFEEKEEGSLVEAGCY